MSTIYFILLLIQGTGNFPPESADAITAIDSIVAQIESTDLGQRHFLATSPSFQGVGYSTGEVILYENRLTEIVDEMLIETDLLYLMKCSYSCGADFLITAYYYFDTEGSLVMCISTWEDIRENEPVCEDCFYFSGDEVLVCSYDGSPLTMPSEIDRDRGYARMEHAEYIKAEVTGIALTRPPIFMEQFTSVYGVD